MLTYSLSIFILWCQTKMFSVYSKNSCSNSLRGDCKPGLTTKKLTVLIWTPDSADQQEYPKAPARNTRKCSTGARRGHERVTTSGVKNATKSWLQEANPALHEEMSQNVTKKQEGDCVSQHYRKMLPVMRQRFLWCTSGPLWDRKLLLLWISPSLSSLAVYSSLIS